MDDPVDTGLVPTASTDADGDGWPAGTDCDESNPSVHPEAVEIPYDGRDQDCDQLDLVDVDGDTWAGVPAGGDDCNDAAADIHPDAVEVCNLKDDDCDGVTDEGCSTATPGELEPGGLYWVCGVASGGSPGWWLVLLLPLLYVRRHAAPLRR